MRSNDYGWKPRPKIRKSLSNTGAARFSLVDCHDIVAGLMVLSLFGDPGWKIFSVGEDTSKSCRQSKVLPCLICEWIVLLRAGLRLLLLKYELLPCMKSHREVEELKISPKMVSSWEASSKTSPLIGSYHADGCD